VALLASGRLVNAATAVPGGGLAVDVAFWGTAPFSPRLWLSGGFSAWDSSGSELALSTTAWSFRAIPTLGLVRTRWIRLDAGAGGGLDLVQATPHDARTPWTMLGSPITTPDAILTAQVLLGLRLSHNAGLFLAMDLDGDVTPRQYTAIDREGRSSAVLAPWSVRPALLAGLCMTLGGASACARTN
jgi:hypothetical protein